MPPGQSEHQIFPIGQLLKNTARVFKVAYFSSR